MISFFEGVSDGSYGLLAGKTINAIQSLKDEVSRSHLL